MSPRLPILSATDLIKLVEKAGFKFARQNGSYMIFYHSKGVRIVIPRHGRKNLHPKIVKEALADIEKTKSI